MNTFCVQGSIEVSKIDLFLLSELKFMRRRGRNMSSTPTKRQTEDIAVLTDKVSTQLV